MPTHSTTTEVTHVLQTHEGTVLQLIHVNIFRSSTTEAGVT